MNALLTKIPTREEIKHAVFDLNKEGAPVSDGFGVVFFQTYWEIIKDDVVNATLQFFTTGWMLLNLNSNSLILILKSPNSDSVDQ